MAFQPNPGYSAPYDALGVPNQGGYAPGPVGGAQYPQYQQDPYYPPLGGQSQSFPQQPPQQQFPPQQPQQQFAQQPQYPQAQPQGYQQQPQQFEQPQQFQQAEAQGQAQGQDRGLSLRPRIVGPSFGITPPRIGINGIQAPRPYLRGPRVAFGQGIHFGGGGRPW